MLYVPTKSSDNATIAYAWKIAKENFYKSMIFDLPITVLMGVADHYGCLQRAEYFITGHNYAFSQPITYSGIVNQVALNVFTGTTAFIIRAIGRDYGNPYAAGFVAGSMKYALKSAWNGGSILLPGIVGGHNNMFYELNNDHTPESMQYYSSSIIEGVEGFIMGFKSGFQQNPAHCLSSGLKQGMFEGVLSASIGWFLTELGERVYAPVAVPVAADVKVNPSTPHFKRALSYLAIGAGAAAIFTASAANYTNPAYAPLCLFAAMPAASMVLYSVTMALGNAALGTHNYIAAKIGHLSLYTAYSAVAAVGVGIVAMNMSTEQITSFVCDVGSKPACDAVCFVARLASGNSNEVGV